MDNKLIGRRISEALVRADMLQKELAKAIGVTDNTISYFCSGTRTPNIPQIIDIARILEVSTDYLLGISDTATLDTTAQAVVAYTGLSEDNVSTLHKMKEQADATGSFAYGVTKRVDGNIPFLECTNDLIDALCSDIEIITEYFLLRAQITCAPDYDPDYYIQEIEQDLFSHGHTTMPVMRAARYSCAELAKRIEWYLRRKYIDRVSRDNTSEPQEDV